MPLLCRSLVVASLVAGSTAASLEVAAESSLKQKLLGRWCLNIEEAGGKMAVNGSEWQFNEDGTYFYHQAYIASGNYRISKNTLILNNYGKMKVLAISDSAMTTQLSSRYHFTRDKCLPLVKQAHQLARLNRAIIEHDMRAVRRLVKLVNLNQRDTRSEMGSTPLMIAIKYGGKDYVKYLLSLNPDLSVQNAQGHTALDVAKRLKNTEIIQLIEQAGNTGKQAVSSNFY